MPSAPVAFATVFEPSDVSEFLAALTPRPTGDGRFASRSPIWWEHERTFGGFTVAQAISASGQTTDPRFALHALHGLFLAPVPPGAELELEVEVVRDGRSFQTRRVTTTCGGRRAFEALLSFHLPEAGDEYQMRTAVDAAPGPEEAEPDEGEWAIEVRELGPTPRREDGTYESTRRGWVRLDPSAPDLSPLEQLVVLGYVSDMTRAAFRPHSLGTWGNHADASLDHALWVHRAVDLRDWHLFDLEAVVNHDGRGSLRGTITSRAGDLVASMGQDLLIREL